MSAAHKTKTVEELPTKAERIARNRYRNKRLVSYAWRAKRPLVTGFVVTALAVFTDLAGPRLIGYIVDQELANGIGALNPQRFGLLLAFFFLSVAAASVFRYLSTYYFRKTANTVARDIQRDVFSHVQRLPIAYFDQLPAGTVVSRVTNDTKAVKTLFEMVLAQMAIAAIYAVGVYINLFLLDWRLFLIAMIPIPMIMVIFVDYKRKSERYTRQYRKSLSQFNGQLNETIQGIEMIQAMGQERRIEAEISVVSDDVYRQGVNMTRLMAYSSYNATEALQYLALGGALLYFGYGHLTGRYAVPIGSLYIFVDYMVKFFGQMQNAMQRTGDLERSKSAADQVFELLQVEKVRESGQVMTTCTGRVTFENICFAYRDEPVLRDVSFTVEPNETVAFVGPTGSGKTTIMNLLLAFIHRSPVALRLTNAP